MRNLSASKAVARAGRTFLHAGRRIPGSWHGSCNRKKRRRHLVVIHCEELKKCADSNCQDFPH
jgi:hypothetical protein